MTDVTLALTFGLVLLAMAISYKEKLGLEKELLLGSLRAVIQLFIIGALLKFVFQVDNFYFTSLILVSMLCNASYVAAKRGAGIKNATLIAFVSISAGLCVTLAFLLGCGALHYQPSEVIPVSGMVVGNSMVATGLLFKTLLQNFSARRGEVEAKLCLGASSREASRALLRSSIRTALVPTVDAMKTLGLVQLPGMMTGLILAGADPQMAIRYQIMVAFMLAGAVSLSSFIAAYWACRGFFNARMQLL